MFVQLNQSSYMFRQRKAAILMLIYLLIAIGLTPSGSSTVHIYTKTIHSTTQRKRIPRTGNTVTVRVHKHNNKNT